MKICNLSNRVELHCDIHGEPYYQKNGRPWEICDHIEKEDREIAENWQKDSQNDCLRARGDARWQAACSFTARPLWHN